MYVLLREDDKKSYIKKIIMYYKNITFKYFSVEWTENVDSLESF